MSPRVPLAIVMVLAAAIPVAGQDQTTVELKRHIDTLSAFDYPTRMNAARMLRRAPAAEVVPALMEAARGHSDQFVRYRALVLLTAFNARATDDLMRKLLTDRNDRVREVAYRWFERHPDAALTLTLMAALETEQAEFVRPALVRAVAALPSDELVQRTLVAEVGRGFDFFRSAVIEALGERRAAYAVEAIASAAALNGPLQDDAVLALGRIGDARALKILPSLEKPSVDVAAAMKAAECLLGHPCASHIESLASAVRGPAAQPAAIRAAVAGLGAIARGDGAARLVLIRLADGGEGRLRNEVALAFAAVALRDPTNLIAWLTQALDGDRALAIDLLREGYDSLEEDFAEEQFYAAARAAYWRAGEGSAARAVAAALIDRLDF